MGETLGHNESLWNALNSFENLWKVRGYRENPKKVEIFRKTLFLLCELEKAFSNAESL